MSVPNRLKSELFIKTYRVASTTTGVNDTSWIDMRNFDNIAVVLKKTKGTGAFGSVVLQGNTSGSGGGTDLTISTYTGTVPATLTGVSTCIETDENQIAQLAGAAGTAGVRYVNLQVAFVDSGDEAAVTYIARGTRQYSGLTT